MLDFTEDIDKFVKDNNVIKIIYDFKELTEKEFELIKELIEKGEGDYTVADVVSIIQSCTIKSILKNTL